MIEENHGDGLSHSSHDLSEVCIFLSAPFSQWLMPGTGRVDPACASKLERLRTQLLAYGASVFSPHHNEAWGARWLEPEDCTPRDFEAMRKADLNLAVLGNPVAPGVTLELGWASALGRSAVIIAEPDIFLPPLVIGLHRVIQCRMLVDPIAWSEEFIEKVRLTVYELSHGRRLGSEAQASELTDLGYVVP